MASNATKQPFDVKVALRRIRKAVEPFPKAALFQLASEGFDSVFEQLVACIISIRTLDEVTVPTARRLFASARTPEAVAELRIKQIDHLIRPCAFHSTKASHIHEIAAQTVKQFGGRLPCDQTTLESFRGVGPKCVSLALGIACDQPQIGVDIHVHRVVNRWGYVQSANPQKTQAALRQKLPRRYCIKLNSLLVPFYAAVLGRHVNYFPCP